jgi:conjugative transfer signal peptidase TraF
MRYCACLSTTMLLTCLGLVAIAWPAIQAPVLRVVYNPSDSVPRGWYRIGPPDSLQVGSIVMVRLPAETASLASQRRYLPDRIPLLKRIGAMSPHEVCVQDRIVLIDRVPVASALTTDWLGRRLPVAQLCRVLHPDELFLLSTTNPASFDGRYFGPVTTSTVIGIAKPMWTWSTP